MITIRMAKQGDLPGILPLLDQLGYPTNLAELEERFKSFAARDGYGVAIACLSDNKIVGWVAWSKNPLFVSPKTRFHVEGLVVDLEHRKQGIGKKLVTFLEDYAKEFRPCIIDLTSGIRRSQQGTHEFYKALGYQNEGVMAKLYLRKEIST
jgi:GNAT superfamily N-acetyltransferase